MVMKGGKKRALSPAKEGEAATIEEVPLTRSVSTRLSGSSFLLRYFYFSSDKVGVNSVVKELIPLALLSGDPRTSLPRS